MKPYLRTLFVLLLAALFTLVHSADAAKKLKRIAGVKPRNILVILTDDHRWDTVGYMNHPFLKTPNIDRLAKNGMIMDNAFVTTSLCSPSRASILTGLYAHNHRVVDNYNPIPKGLTWFPEYLQKSGYETAFVGKWHMGGDIDDPQPGFDHWISFKGQGVYWPFKDGLNVKGRYVPQAVSTGYNINGKHVEQKDYMTDELTGFALDWLEGRDEDKPFMLYLSHKAVHADFLPPNRYAYKYDKEKFEVPPAPTKRPELFNDVPMWVKNQHNSRHGAEFAYYEELDLAKYYRRYCETILSVDESTGKLIDFLEKSGQLEDTLILYMGDNGFLFGEHGLIDKRNAYEESIRVPLVLHCPDLIPANGRSQKVVANIDIAPTLLEAAGLKTPDYMDGESFLKITQGVDIPWRDNLLYEYYWERNYPHTPTTHAVRGERYKYIRYHGVWDLAELYDLKEDPKERNNLINDPAHAERIEKLNKRLWELLDESKGMDMPLAKDRGHQFYHRRTGGTKGATFPQEFYRTQEELDGVFQKKDAEKKK
ncbi:sulfatase [bacterium]|nr:sulfatase [bacterium]